ncbi:hypothetical protein [Telluribacter sp.]|jgi:hypothetical protein|uniref:hypothetical protein n=1 Tax=Telluribacter sp. TaxID=1978767 RepID=UPI002E140639|nr:hypothetical protein [Telluribacter sp.]
MRKRIIVQEQENVLSNEGKWLDVQSLAQVEVTSEEEAFPIEAAFELTAPSAGWRAAKAGKQTIRIIFDEPQRVNTIHLLFKEEQQQARTQEFVLRWSPEAGPAEREIVRQQYNFSPESSIEEKETFTVYLDGVRVVELAIVPDVSGGSARASISRFWFE